MNLREVFSAMTRDGLTVSLAGDDRLKITGKELTDKQRSFLHRLKQAILAELRLQAFIDLVRITGICEHGLLLHRDDIAAQLDAADIAELFKTDRRDRQVWAELLAHRLCMKRLGL